jgi:hypothetical protein
MFYYSSPFVGAEGGGVYILFDFKMRGVIGR